MTPDRRRLEIVHESLMTRWPRLARWRAQDEEGAVLRDQLRQAAQSWDRHGRADDFLWTGTAFREYQLWRERYPGGLTALEDAFARAMTRLARRRRLRRQVAVVTVMVALAVGVAVFAVLRQRAVHAARRAEASMLLALGEVELERTPTVALAYAIKSLELEDSPAARVFAVRALAAGPPAFLHPVGIVRQGQVNRVTFSPDGAWAVVIGASEKLHVVSRNGGGPRDLHAFPSGTGGVAAQFDDGSKHLYAAKDGQVRIWSVPDFRLVETQQVGGTFTSLRRRALGMLAITRVRQKPSEMAVWILAAGQSPRPVGRFVGFNNWDLSPDGTSVALAEEQGVMIRSLADARQPPRRVVNQAVSSGLLYHPSGDRLAGYDEASRTIRVWSTLAQADVPLREMHTALDPLTHYVFDPEGRHLSALGRTRDGLHVESWDLEASLDQAARVFPATFGGFLSSASFSPDGRWLATANFHAVCFWPVATRHHVLTGHQAGVTGVRFTPDGKRIISRDRSGEVREWTLGAGGKGRTLAQLDHWGMLNVDPRGRFVAVAQRGGVRLIPLDGGETRALAGFGPTTNVMAVAVDRDGSRVAAAAYWGPRQDKVIRVWELESGKVWTLGPTEIAGEGGAGQVLGLGFLADGSLVSAGDGLRRWSIEKGTHELIAPSHVQTHLSVFPDGQSVAYKVAGDRSAAEGDPRQPLESVWVAVTDFRTTRTDVIRSHGRRHLPLAVDPTGTLLVTGGLDGIVRVGSVTGGEPHLLLGHEGWIHGVAVSPDGRWVAAGGDDRKIHVWPMPDMSKPPLHVLPRQELVAKLKALTNLRVVEESKSRISAWLRTDRGTGYELDLEPFPGWAKPPEP